MIFFVWRCSIYLWTKSQLMLDKPKVVPSHPQKYFTHAIPVVFYVAASYNRATTFDGELTANDDLFTGEHCCYY